MLRNVNTFASVKASLAVGEGDTVQSARWGIATWKVGILAGLFCAFDVFVGRTTHTADVPLAMVASREQFARAKALLSLLEGSREKWLHVPSLKVPTSVLRMSQQTPDFLAGIPEAIQITQVATTEQSATVPGGMPGGMQKRAPCTLR